MKVKKADVSKAIIRLMNEFGHTRHEAIEKWLGMSQKDRKRYVINLGVKNENRSNKRI